MDKILAIFLLALSTGLDNFAVSIALGISGIKNSNKIKTALTIGVFESFMTIAGLMIGNNVIKYLGESTHYIGGSLLILTGIYAIVAGYRMYNKEAPKIVEKSKFKQRLLVAMSLSIDNLIVGFGFGSQSLPLVETSLIVALVSVTLAMIGIWLGGKISHKIEEYSEFVSGGILILVGLLIFTKVI